MYSENVAGVIFLYKKAKVIIGVTVLELAAGTVKGWHQSTRNENTLAWREVAKIGSLASCSGSYYAPARTGKKLCTLYDAAHAKNGEKQRIKE